MSKYTWKEVNEQLEKRNGLNREVLTYDFKYTDEELGASFNIKNQPKHTNKELLRMAIDFTNVIKNNDLSKIQKEVEGNKVMFPATLVSPEEIDWTVGRIDRGYIGFGSATSTGGVGQYYHFGRMANFKKQLKYKEDKRKVDELEIFWTANDTRNKFYMELFNTAPSGVSCFIDVHAHTDLTSRLSGMQLYMQELIEIGIDGIKLKIKKRELEVTTNEQKEYLWGLSETINLFERTMIKQSEIAQQWAMRNHGYKKEWFLRVSEACGNVSTNPPKNYLEAIELVWTYIMISGTINYGRMDKLFGKFAKNDLESGTFTYKELLNITKSIFAQMAYFKTAFNGRVIIGGRDIEGNQDAIFWQKLSINAVMENHLEEPQLTIRWSKGIDRDVYLLALDAIETGLTFPMFVNDEVLIDAVKNVTKMPESFASNYTPLGCGEITVEGRGVASPNLVQNVATILNVQIMRGINPSDNLDASAGFKFKDINELDTYQKFEDEYFNFFNMLTIIGVKYHDISYDYMDKDVSFLLLSLMTKDNIQKAKPILQGGIEHISGSNEIYGSINTFEALYNIKKYVYDKKSISLKDLQKIIKTNWEGYEWLRKEIIDGEHYGNDIPEIDNFINRVHIRLTKLIKDSWKHIDAKYLESYGAVYINNHANAMYGRATAATFDGRKAGDILANGNTPQPGFDKNGPTAFLTSLAGMDTQNNLGMVHNIKFSKDIFKKKELVGALFETYFEKGGSQLMVTVTNKADLLAALETPDDYQNLLVRVGGFTAKFIQLSKDVQLEIINRTDN